MSERRSRIISRRVVGERVIGSANPVARWGRQSGATCMNSIGGFFLGIVLFCVTFAVPYCAARTEKDSFDIARLSPVSAEAAAGQTGKVLFEGTAIATSALPLPKGDAQNILAYHYLVEDYKTWTETHNETHTEVRNGKDVEVTEEVTEEKSDWKPTLDQTRWALVKVGPFSIDPQQARMDLPWETIYTEQSRDQKHREKVEVVRGSIPVLVAAELEDGRIKAEPDFYHVTTKNKDELVASLGKAEEAQRWLLIALSVILWTVSLTLIAGPGLVVFNIMPVRAIGGAVRGGVTLLSFITACIMTWVIYVMVRYWWVIIILLALLAVAIVILANRNRKAEPDVS